MVKMTNEAFITHLLHFSESKGNLGPLRPAQKSHFDHLAKCFAVCFSTQSQLHRRVDIVVALPESFGCAVLGWTG